MVGTAADCRQRGLWSVEAPLVHNNLPRLPVTGGDDAYFINAGDSGALDLGVFDGVGGWSRRGYDPGVFTRGFAKAAAGETLTFMYLTSPLVPGTD